MKTCLIVDDSRVVRKLARLMLEGLDFDCREVDDGPQAVIACKEAMPDVVFMDWNMPLATGIETMQKLRDLPGGKAAKVIFCTVYNEMAYIREALDAGADEYIMKPFDADIVASKLQIVGAL
jgi:two-component system, chemotaxis family, chemotaxis protein CheY